MRPPQMSEEQRAAYESSLLQQRQTGVPTVDPARGPVTTVLSAEVMDEPQAKRHRTIPAQVKQQYAQATAEALGAEEVVRRARMQPAPRISPRLVPVGRRGPGDKWVTRPTTVESDKPR